MEKLTPESLMTLEAYARERPAFRKRVIDHKSVRTLLVGPHAALYFEDRLTMQYQVQEMLRIERIFEPTGIQEELDAYNPLIPDGSNWKATFMIQVEDADDRRALLARLIGVEDRVWVAVGGGPRLWAVADEDIERENEDKTSSVHFLRFELDAASVASLKAGASVGLGIDHDQYRHAVDPVPAALRTALTADLD